MYVCMTYRCTYVTVENMLIIKMFTNMIFLFNFIQSIYVTITNTRTQVNVRFAVLTVVLVNNLKIYTFVLLT